MKTYTITSTNALANIAAPASITTNTDAFFADETNAAYEARAQTIEAITRFLIWIAEGTHIQGRGARATIALYCVRPDLIEGITLEQIGAMSGTTKQAAYKLAHDFRLNMGLVS